MNDDGAWTKAPLVREWGTPELLPLMAALQARRAKHLPVDDFITAHPYDHGFRFDPALLGEIMSGAVARSCRYAADPLGQLAAREAVSFYHKKTGGTTAPTPVSPAHILLTPGTSIAYYYLFRLLAVTHGEVLCPVPTYPLFEDLARLAGLKVRRYHLQMTVTDAGTTRWAIDPEELAFQITPRTCAIVVVSPHNPTGSIIGTAEMEAIVEVANRAGVPLILDEVFRTYTRDDGVAVARPDEHGARLSFTLNGLSKSHYLPGIKAGWLVAEGEPSVVTPVMQGLEYMSDAFLPVQEMTQAALPALLGERALAEADRLAAKQREQLEARLVNNCGWPVATPEAGPYVCVPVKGIGNEFADRLKEFFGGDPLEENLALMLLGNHGALFHPGSLYGFPEPWLVSTIYNQAPWPERAGCFI